MEAGPEASAPTAAIARAVYRLVAAAARAGCALRAPFARGETALRLHERRGSWTAASAGDWIWIHAASVGEAEIAVAVARGIASRRPGLRLVVSTMTAGGRARAAREAGVETHYFPVDCPASFERILNPRPPLLFAAVETEIWPELLAALASRGVPAAVVNARISDRSWPRYRRFAALLAPRVATLAAVCARELEDARRWRALGVREAAIRVCGNIKFDLALPPEGVAGSVLFARDAARPLLVAGSTHDGEEELVVDAFARARHRLGAAMLLLVPRHPERAGAVASIASGRGLRTRLWSQLGERQPGDAMPDLDAVVIDRFGLLRPAYASATGAFVGGSVMAGPGGHNLLEPVVAGCPVAAGGETANVADQVALLEEHAAIWPVANIEQLSSFFVETVEHPGRFRDPLRAVTAALAQRRGALDRNVDALLALLPRDLR